MRLKDRDLVITHLNTFNTMVSQFLCVDINIIDEDKCINRFCSLPDSLDSLVVATGSNTITLNFDKIISSSLSKEMR